MLKSQGKGLWQEGRAAPAKLLPFPSVALLALWVCSGIRGDLLSSLSARVRFFPKPQLPVRKLIPAVPLTARALACSRS